MATNTNIAKPRLTSDLYLATINGLQDSFSQLSLQQPSLQSETGAGYYNATPVTARGGPPASMNDLTDGLSTMRISHVVDHVVDGLTELMVSNLNISSSSNESDSNSNSSGGSANFERIGAYTNKPVGGGDSNSDNTVEMLDPEPPVPGCLTVICADLDSYGVARKQIFDLAAHMIVKLQSECAETDWVFLLGATCTTREAQERGLGERGGGLVTIIKADDNNNNDGDDDYDMAMGMDDNGAGSGNAKKVKAVSQRFFPGQAHHVEQMLAVASDVIREHSRVWKSWTTCTLEQSLVLLTDSEAIVPGFNKFNCLSVQMPPMIPRSHHRELEYLSRRAEKIRFHSILFEADNTTTGSQFKYGAMWFRSWDDLISSHGPLSNNGHNVTVEDEDPVSFLPVYKAETIEEWEGVMDRIFNCTPRGWEHKVGRL